MIEVFKKHISYRSLPKNIRDEDLKLFSHEIHKTINSTTLLVANNIYILKDSVFDLKKIKFYFYYSHIRPLTTISLLQRLLYLFNKETVVDHAIWISDNWSSGYFHWITDALTRLVAVEDYITNHKIILPSYLKKYDFIKESLDYLKFTYVFVNNKTLCKELLLPSHTSPTGNYNREIINKLRLKFIKNQSLIPTKKIYISREKANKRKIINENELIVLLKKFNFEILYMEQLSFIEQVVTLSNTKSLIGLHGAGLANMVFMPENGNIIELRNLNDAQNNCYFSLASDLKHNYYYLLCDGNNENTHIADVEVNTKKINEILEILQ